MESRVFLAEGISAKAFENYLSECRSEGINLRTVQIYKKSEPVLRFCFKPYRFEDPMHLYSLSKSFTSVAVGICRDEGLLSTETTLGELFADKFTEGTNEEAKKIKISDLLSMQSGHGECKLYKMRWADDAVKAFISEPLDHEPGSVFIYSTGATAVCAAAVERVTGKKTVDFLYEKLFSKLGIEKPRWREMRDGCALGGIGLYLSSDDITKFMLMLYNGGVWNGERILSRSYINEATSRHSLDVNNGAPDWIAGYGYQFWLNERGGFRGDGAFGQLGMVFPEEDTVVTVTGEVGNMSTEVRLLYKLLDDLEGGDGDISALEYIAEHEYMTAETRKFQDDVTYKVGENSVGINALRLYGENLLHAVLYTDYGVHEIVCGNGEYILNHCNLKNFNPNISRLDPDTGALERVSVFAAYELGDNGLKITLRHKDTCHVQRWTVADGKWTVDLYVGDLPEKEFTLIKEESGTV